MAQIATKFVQWDVPELATLQGSRVYKLREHLNNGGKLNREDKNWITRNVSESTYFKRGIRQTIRAYPRILCHRQNRITLNTVWQD